MLISDDWQVAGCSRHSLCEVGMELHEEANPEKTFCRISSIWKVYVFDSIVSTEYRRKLELVFWEDIIVSSDV